MKTGIIGESILTEQPNKTLLASGIRCFYRCNPDKNKACTNRSECYQNGGRCYLTSVKEFAKSHLPDRIFKEGEWD